MKKPAIVLLLVIPAIAAAQVVDRTNYCASGPTTTTSERINAFALKEIVYTNTTTCTSYNDLTERAVSMAPGESVSGSVTLGSCSASVASSSVRIFIDWNADNDFDDQGETVFTANNAVNATTAIPFSFTVPIDVQIGKVTLMRVVNQAATTPSNIEPCGSFTRGETQDYTVQFTNFSDHAIAALNYLITAMFPGDFDNDGDPDLFIMENTPSVMLFRNTTTTPGVPTFVNTGIAFPSNAIPDGWLDFNNDGFLDMMTHIHNGAATVYLNNGGTSFTPITMPFGSVNGTIVWADYDHDGDLDFHVPETGGLKMYVQQMNKSFIAQPTSGRGIFYDFDSDNDSDKTDGWHIYTNVSGEFEQTHNFFPTNEGMSTSLPAFADYDNDGDEDIMVVWNRAEYGFGSFVYLRNDQGIFTRIQIPSDFEPGWQISIWSLISRLVISTTSGSTHEVRQSARRVRSILLRPGALTMKSSMGSTLRNILSHSSPPRDSTLSASSQVRPSMKHWYRQNHSLHFV